ncbi:MAG: putative manganese transporter [Oscillospiraceae bacterium]|nr:putative manganese transporter [Oscillospiraceae bacterium]
MREVILADFILEVLLDAGIDTLKMIPFLFLAYLVIEYVEHHQSKRLEKALTGQSKYGFLTGAALGVFPQCGFSAMAANLYASKVITVGTLVAVFISTSDEAIPMLFAAPGQAGIMLKLVGLKVVFAAIAGFLIDFVLKKLIPIGLGGYENSVSDCDCHEHNERDSVLLAAVKHTVHITLYIFLFSLVIGFVVEWIGMDTIKAFLSSIGPWQLLVAGIVGFIPNCAASIMLTQLYIEGGLAFSAAVTGLCTGAGVGILVLFKQNRNWKENLCILALVYIFSVLAGLAVMMLGM